MAAKKIARKLGTRTAKTGVRIAKKAAKHPITKAAKKQVKQAVKRKMNAKIDQVTNEAVRRIGTM